MLPNLILIIAGPITVLLHLYQTSLFVKSAHRVHMLVKLQLLITAAARSKAWVLSCTTTTLNYWVRITLGHGCKRFFISVCYPVRVGGLVKGRYRKNNDFRNSWNWNNKYWSPTKVGQATGKKTSRMSGGFSDTIWKNTHLYRELWKNKCFQDYSDSCIGNKGRY